MTSQYILRFDDVTERMAWSKFSPIKAELESLNIQSVLGVVPENRDLKLNVEPPKQDYFDLLRRFRDFGDSILQHGTHHLYTTENSGLLKINRRSEFAGLDLVKQLRLLEQGKAILEQERLWQPYFMAPAHSFDTNTLEALRQLNFRAISDGYGLFPYEMRGITLVPQLASHPLPWLGGIQTICVHVNTCSPKQIETLIKFIRKKKDRFLNFKKVVEEFPHNSSSLSRRLTALILRTRRVLRP